MSAFHSASSNSITMLRVVSQIGSLDIGVIFSNRRAGVDCLSREFGAGRRVVWDGCMASEDGLPYYERCSILYG